MDHSLDLPRGNGGERPPLGAVGRRLTVAVAPARLLRRDAGLHSRALIAVPLGYQPVDNALCHLHRSAIRSGNGAAALPGPGGVPFSRSVVQCRASIHRCANRHLSSGRRFTPSPAKKDPSSNSTGYANRNSEQKLSAATQEGGPRSNVPE